MKSEVVTLQSDLVRVHLVHVTHQSKKQHELYKKNEVGRKYSIAYQKSVDKRIDECEKVIQEMKERDRFHCHRQEQLERVQKLFHELAEILESLQEN